MTNMRYAHLYARPPTTTKTPATPAATPMIRSQTSDLQKVGWKNKLCRCHLGQASPWKPHFGRSLELALISVSKTNQLVPGGTLATRPGNRSLQAQQRQWLSSVVQIQLGGKVEPGNVEFRYSESKWKAQRQRQRSEKKDKRLNTRTKTKTKSWGRR